MSDGSWWCFTVGWLVDGCICTVEHEWAQIKSKMAKHVPVMRHRSELRMRNLIWPVTELKNNVTGLFSL